jgi:hypothetical protein
MRGDTIGRNPVQVVAVAPVVPAVLTLIPTTTMIRPILNKIVVKVAQVKVAQVKVAQVAAVLANLNLTITRIPIPLLRGTRPQATVIRRDIPPPIMGLQTMALQIMELQGTIPQAMVVQIPVPDIVPQKLATDPIMMLLRAIVPPPVVLGGDLLVPVPRPQRMALPT